MINHHSNQMNIDCTPLPPHVIEAIQKTMEDITALYHSFIGQKVNVEIACYSYGFMYPEENVLVDITETHYIFKSDEIESEDGLWRFDHTNKDCSCELSLLEIENPE